MTGGRELERFEADFSMLAAHAKRDALFLVADGLELEQVARAIAADETAKVTAWLQSGELRRPSMDELGAWESEPGAGFVVVIVQPFVLARRQTS